MKNNSSNKPKLVSFDKIASLNFSSADQTIHYSIACMTTDTFAEVEEKLYNVYPEYIETKNIFLVDGRQILRFKTIEQNNIKPGFPIVLITPS